jgi:hypothetical protein
MTWHSEITKLMWLWRIRHVDHQSSMVEIEGMINKKYVSILIDPGASLSYVSPIIVEDCKLNKVKHNKSWLVQLATEY